jgi:hypothetical protein
MKHLKKFENFQINEEEEILGLFADKQKKIAQYTKELLEGTISEDLKKDFEKYKSAKPVQGLGSSMGTWLTYVTNIDDMVKSPAKPSEQLEDCFGKTRPAAEVIEEEAARMILKDRLVTKKSGKWEIEQSGRSFKGATHTFGSGE